MKALRCDLDRFIKALGAEGVPCGPVFWPQSYRENIFRSTSARATPTSRSTGRNTPTRSSVPSTEDVSLPNAAKYQQNAFFTLCHPLLEPEHMRLIAEGIKEFSTPARDNRESQIGLAE